MTRKQKLELTWVGKEQRTRLEPRILIENPELSYHAATRREDDIFDNVLIQGDNLLALRAVQQEFAGKVQCIYIDPPFNTGEAYDHYDDGIEHSIWLSMIDARVRILHNLLSDSGTIFIHIDDNELGYLIAICDSIFGRQNRISVISFKQSSVSGPKARNPGVVSIASFILVYAKQKSQWKNVNTFRKIQRDARYNQYIVNFEKPIDEWSFIPLSAAVEKVSRMPFSEWEKAAGRKFEEKMERFVLDNRERVAQLVSVAEQDVNGAARQVLIASRTSSKVQCSPRDGADDYFFFNGKQVVFYRSKTRVIDGALTTAERVSNIWDDLLSNNIHKEGGVKFQNGKKPEALIKRCLEMTTSPGDLVLDSFLGSGTTAAVAHKMGRRWIGIELGEHAKTHCQIRLRSVVEGEDQEGITKAVGWRGGGGFRFYRLAPSLLERDRFSNWVIAKEYNPAMLAEAMCKLMGFTYAPSLEPEAYWQHGHSSETDFIYVTTQSLTHDALRKLSEEVGSKRTLLVCCKAFSGREVSFLNLTIKKIPKVVLTKCEWGRDDYSLRIANLPVVEDEPVEAAADDIEPSSVVASRKRGRPRKGDTGEASLFAELSLDPEEA
ncbi:site-specific DNA-methyltransferase [Limobrevibacterium gyesilva]|uniref:site-specific DNA-methyltransferase (adenine-specific) n=1 Tax=Limobrevibacterium gyesilva TaxID=2991712 RepID=A0AA41YLW9_9PROT|nr:DNA methyltransferase [Limobrevibacterium gyesilva]MCW3476294.1 DNA methyltransferase [Limobrevibacterium gyesilva]